MGDEDRLGRHLPVMSEEVVEVLRVRPGGLWVDATIGEGGHAARILEACAPDGMLLGLDWDDDALALSAQLLSRFGSRLKLVRSGFGALAAVLAAQGWADGVDGILVDLGVSTLQLGRAQRGFSFAAEGPLDMRMDRRRATTAADLVNRLDERELADLLYRYGQEPAARRIARRIVSHRRNKPLETTAELRRVVIQAGARTRPGRDPATRTFQALRIAVNGELAELEKLLEGGWRLLRPGGRLAILSYHSIEDRLVKQTFRKWASDCICPPERLLCDCGWRARVRQVTRGRVAASPEEVAANPRARSAGLRAVERLQHETEAQ